MGESQEGKSTETVKSVSGENYLTLDLLLTLKKGETLDFNDSKELGDCIDKFLQGGNKNRLVLISMDKIACTFWEKEIEFTERIFENSERTITKIIQLDEDNFSIIDSSAMFISTFCYGGKLEELKFFEAASDVDMKEIKTTGDFMKKAPNLLFDLQ